MYNLGNKRVQKNDTAFWRRENTLKQYGKHYIFLNRVHK